MDGDECEPSVAYVPIWRGGIVPSDSSGLGFKAAASSAPNPAVVCWARSASSANRDHRDDRAVGFFVVDPSGCANERLVLFFVVGGVLREVVDDVARDGPFPVSASTGNGGKNADVVVSGSAGGTGHGELVSAREHWQGVAAAGPHGLPAFTAPNVGIVVIVVSTPPDRDNCGVGSTCRWSPTLSLCLREGYSGCSPR